MPQLRWMVVVLVVGSLFLTAVTDIAAHPLETIPPSHWAYPALRHLAVAGLIPFRTLSHLPLTRGEITELVRRAESAARLRSITPGTRDLLAALRREFLSDGTAVNPQVTLRAASLPDARTVFPGTAPGSYAGGGAGTGGTSALAWAEGGVTSSGAQLTRAYGIARFGSIYLQAGREIQHWSPSPRTSLLLSEWAGGTDLVRVVVDAGRLRFSKFVTPLRPGPRTVYLVGTRLDWQATDRFRIGFSESVLTYADRMLIYAVLDPLPVLLTQALDPTRLQVRWFRTSTVNFLGAIDFDWLIKDGFTLSGQVLVDDYSAVGDRPHRLGGLLAMTWADPFRNGRTSLRVEYSAVLNHTYTDMARSRFSYLLPGGRLLGYWLGNDADDLTLELQHVLSPTATFSGWVARTRHGEGRVGMVWGTPRSSFRRMFLSGVVETRWAVGAQYDTFGAARTIRYWAEIGSIQNLNNKLGRNGMDILLGVQAQW